MVRYFALMSNRKIYNFLMNGAVFDRFAAISVDKPPLVLVGRFQIHQFESAIAFEFSNAVVLPSLAPIAVRCDKK